MQRFILAIGLIGAALMLQGCSRCQELTRCYSKAAPDTDVKSVVATATAEDCQTAVKAVCDAVVADASAVEVKKLADGGKKVCDLYGVGKILGNPTKYSACKAKLAQYAKDVSTMVGDWESACNDEVQKRVLQYYCCPAQRFCPKGGLNATKVSVAAENYIKLSSGKTNFYRKGESDKLAAMQRFLLDKLAELATYTSSYTAAARLYDATVPTPADTYAPFVMISFGAATVMVMGSAALGLKQFLQNRQISYSSAAIQNDEDQEEEAAGHE